MTIKEFKKRFNNGEPFIFRFNDGKDYCIYKTKGVSVEIIGDVIDCHIIGYPFRCFCKIEDIVPVYKFIRKTYNEKLEDEKKKILLAKFAIAMQFKKGEEIFYDDILKHIIEIKHKTNSALTLEESAINLCSADLLYYIENNYQKEKINEESKN